MKNERNIDFRVSTTSRHTRSEVEDRSSSGVEMHRHLEGVCNMLLQNHDLINMNGRIYDPVTAQFLQADNYIQSPEDFIDYNRYAYCRYNPFKYTDPSGEYWVYFDPNMLNEVPEGTQGASSYWVDDAASMEWNRLQNWMHSDLQISPNGTQTIRSIPGGCGGSTYGSSQQNNVGTDGTPILTTTPITFVDKNTGKSRTFDVPDESVDDFNKMIKDFGTIPTYDEMLQIDTDKRFIPWEKTMSVEEYEIPAILGTDGILRPGDLSKDRDKETNALICTKQMSDLISRYYRTIFNWFLHTHPQRSGSEWMPSGHNLSHPGDYETVTGFRNDLNNPNIRGIIKTCGSYTFFDERDAYIFPSGFYTWERR